MAKLSRRKRKELEEKSIDRRNLKKERRKTINEEGYVPKRFRVCREHDYQVDESSGYVCSNCQHHVENTLMEDVLRKYFSSKTVYKVSEIRELAKNLKEVSWYYNTRGQRIVHQVEPVKDLQWVIEKYGNWICGIEINEDGSFPELKLSPKIKKIDRELQWESLSEEQIERLEAEWVIDGVSSGYSFDDELVMEQWYTEKYNRKRLIASKWYYETEDGKILVYTVWRYKQWRMSFFDDHIMDEKSPWLFISQCVYSKSGKFEKIVVKGRGGVSYTLME